jgi:pyruvate dehydrogenase E1 component
VTVPNCRAYDPAFAYEVAIIFDHGARKMIEEQADVFYYITVANENYAQPSQPPATEDGVIKGMYRYMRCGPAGTPVAARLLGSGAILQESIAAAQLLVADWNVATEVWSVTSFAELAREAREIERWNRLHSLEQRKTSYVLACLPGMMPIIAASDYVSAYAGLIAGYVDARYIALGTDGFGRSDSRAVLRAFFEVDRYHIVLAVLDALIEKGTLDADVAATAASRYLIDAERAAPWTR